MGKISSYINASSPISGSDKLIGTDSANNNETKNFTVQEIADFVGLGPYKVYTALLTQNGESNVLEKVQGDTLVLGVTYFIFINEDNVDLTVFGAPNSNEGTYFVCTQVGNLPGAVNISLQYNTGAPVVTVLENTIGNVWFTYEGEGYYHLMSDLLFTQNKIWTCITLNVGGMGDNISNSIYYNSNGDLLVITGIGGDSALNGLLNNTPIEIRVYN